MTVQFLRAFTRNAGAGTNYLRLSLNHKQTLKLINLRNATTAWLRSNVVITWVGAANDDLNTMTLVSGIIQCGDKDVHWEGEIKLDSPYIDILATFFNCEVGDVLFLTVGFE